jgi:predicted flap endonuclease-1-like 5' DNA nuclease
MKLEAIEGIGPVYQKKLNAIGIRGTGSLLKKGATPRGRKEIAEKVGGVGPKLVLEWVNAADLFRIKGVGSEYADLLEEAGVDTVVELAARVPAKLHETILKINEKKHLVRRPPALSLVKNWVAQAKKLPRVVQY